MKLEAVIFDLDGTLIDSEDNYHRADAAFLETHGIRLPEKAWEEVVGVGSRSFLQTLQREYGLVGDIDDLLREKDENYLELASHNTRVFPQMLSFIRICASTGLPMAVASGSSKVAIEQTLLWAEINQYFDLVVSADEVEKGKPEPDIFLEAAKRLGIHSASCMVVEDSQYGVLAAKAAGMFCVGIPTVNKPPLAKAFGTADILIQGGMEFFSAEQLVQSLIKSKIWPGN